MRISDWSSDVGSSDLARPGLDLFDGDDMFPIVAHVVGIEELTNAAVEQGTELGVFGGKQAVIVPVGIEHAVMPFLRLELPEVVIEPAHRALDDIMEHFEAEIGRAACRERVWQ